MSTREILLEAVGVGKRFGGFVALENVDLEIRPGERVGLIGPNGSGKSTFINCLSGATGGYTGVIRFRGEDIDRLPAHKRTRLGIARTFQIPLPFATMTVLENLRIPLRFAAWHRPGTSARGDIDGEAMNILADVAMQDKAHALSASLTQVEMRKLELARAVAARPAVLIADESMAGLSNSEVDEILRLLFRLNEQGITIIMIEHIMRAVMTFSQRAIVLVAGRKIADATPELVMRNPEVIRAYLGE
jgi:branched-chain amino acid transport system ATP-binding protein